MKKLITLITLITLAGCSSPQPKNDSQKTIVTSFYPLHYITEQIVQDKFEVKDITKGKDPHSYSLTPKDTQSLQSADLFVYQGANLESWAEDIIASHNLSSFNAFDSLGESEKIMIEDNHEDQHDHEEDDSHHDEQDEEHSQEDDLHDHDHGGVDPHTWLDPILLSQVAENLTNQIIQIDPSNQDLYQTNLSTLQSELTDLDQQFQQNLAQCQNKKALSSHDAFAYLEKRYNFEIHPIKGLSTDNTPSSQDLVELIELAEAENVTHILSEQFTNQNFTNTVQSETGLETLVVNTLESEPQDNQDYFDIMFQNLSSFTQAFNCNNQ